MQIEFLQWAHSGIKFAGMEKKAFFVFAVLLVRLLLRLSRPHDRRREPGRPGHARAPLFSPLSSLRGRGRGRGGGGERQSVRGRPRDEREMSLSSSIVALSLAAAAARPPLSLRVGE